MAGLAYPCVDAESQRRDVAGVCTPPKCRASRLLVTSLHHMLNNIHRFEDALKEPMSSFVQMDGEAYDPGPDPNAEATRRS
jgi:hypothetical protein